MPSVFLAGTFPSASIAGTYPPQQSFAVPMSDGTLLDTEVWFPQDGHDPWPVILCRTPYGAETALPFAVLVELGYVAMCQDIRGFSESEGTFSFFRDEGWGPSHEDGRETMEWILAQPWCNGKVSTVGGSAVGITQNLLMGSVPPGLASTYVSVGASDLYLQLVFPGGEFRRADIVAWLTGIGYAPLLDTLAEHAVKDSWWSWLDVNARFAEIETPSYQVGGWYDLILQGSLSTFTGLQYAGGVGALGNQKLMIGPWHHSVGESPCGELTFPDHGTATPEALIGSLAEWWDYWQKDVPNGVMDRPPIAYYLMGDPEMPDAPGNEWRTAAVWPPPAIPTAYYLLADGALSRTVPVREAPALSYAFDPADPVPTVGGANLTLPRGAYDQRSIENRADVLVFTTPPLEREVEVVGPIEVVLYAASDALDTDFTAKLTDVYPDGRSMLVCDGILKARFRNGFSEEELLQPGQIERFVIDLWQTAIVFAPGHRIRVAISSSNYPRFEVNPNTGAPFWSKQVFQVATNTVYVDASYASHIVLPVTNTDPSSSPEIAWNTAPFRIEPGENPSRSIRFRLLAPTRTELHARIYAANGRLLHTLLPEGSIVAGSREIAWDGCDRHGRLVPSGAYFVRLDGGRGGQTWAVRLIR